MSRLQDMRKRFLQEMSLRDPEVSRKEWLEQRFQLLEHSIEKINGSQLDSKVWGLVMGAVVVDDILLDEK